MNLKLTLKPLKPRNPFVAASYRAPAGAHRSTRRHRLDQRDQRSLRDELARLNHERHHT